MVKMAGDDDLAARLEQAALNEKKILGLTIDERTIILSTLDRSNRRARRASRGTR